MNPLHFWALGAAGVGLALPIAIHLMTRPRGTRFSLPTYQFLIAAAGISARHNRLRSILILAARALALLLLALGFARFSERTRAEPLAGGTTRRVIVLDCSMSMNAHRGGNLRVFDQARTVAQRLVSDGTAQEAELILAAQTARPVFGQTSANVNALQEELGRASVLPQILDAGAAMAAVAQSLKKVPEGDRPGCEVVILSDFQRTSWVQASFTALPKGVRVKLVNAREAGVLANVGVASAQISGVAEAGAACVALAEIVNFSASACDAEVELAFDDHSWTRRVRLGAAARANVAFELTSLAPGWRYGFVRVRSVDGIRDALSEDNSFPLSVYVRPARRIVLISVERPTEVGGPAYFLSRALAASPDANVDIQRIQPGQLDGEPDGELLKADLVVLANCRKLSDGQASGVARLLARGTSILLVANTPVDADNLRAIETASGAALRLPVEFVPLRNQAATSHTGLSALTGRGGGDNGERFLVSADTQRRPFKIFGEALPQLTRTLRLSGGLGSAVREQNDAANQSIRAKYADGAAALVVVRAGAGRLAALNMNVSGESGTLAAHPIFVPMIQELTQELIEDDSANRAANKSGRPMSLLLPANIAANEAEEDAAKSAARWRVVRADGSPVGTGAAGDPVFKVDTNGVTLLWPECGAPDVYRVERSGSTAGVFVVAPPVPEESDLAALESDVLKRRIEETQAVSVSSSSLDDEMADTNKEHFEIFFLGALVCLFLEMAMLKAFRS